MHRRVARTSRASIRSDERVLAIFLAGGLGRGDGDEFSDVDLLIAVAEGGRDDFVDEWSELAASISPIVLEQRIGGTGTVIFSQVTDEWVRFDATVVTPPAWPNTLQPASASCSIARTLPARWRRPNRRLKPIRRPVQRLP